MEPIKFVVRGRKRLFCTRLCSFKKILVVHFSLQFHSFNIQEQAVQNTMGVCEYNIHDGRKRRRGEIERRKDSRSNEITNILCS